MQSLMFLGRFDQKLSKKNLWGGRLNLPLVKEVLNDNFRSPKSPKLCKSGQVTKNFGKLLQSSAATTVLFSKLQESLAMSVSFGSRLNLEKRPLIT